MKLGESGDGHPEVIIVEKKKGCVEDSKPAGREVVENEDAFAVVVDVSEKEFRN
jgi:hypothetical protein